MASAQLAPNHEFVSASLPAVRSHRIRAGITLESICERTKITRCFLEAIEERAYHRLPGGVFDVNYIRQYAEQIGYCAQELLEDYRRALRTRDEQAQSTASAPSPSKTWWRCLL